MSESVKERELRNEAMRHRRKVRALEAALVGYQERELQRLVEPLLPWSVFTQMIGVENVVDGHGRIDLEELSTRINARHATMPEVIPRRVSVADFASDQ